LTDRYEALRRTRARSLERDLFMQQGMAGWMKAWANCVPAKETRGGREAAYKMDNAREGEEALPVGSDAQVVHIIAGIVSSVLRSS
jgi:hypothetical protein